MKEQNISLLLTCTEWNVMPRERNQLLRRLIAAMDNVYHLTIRADKLQISMEQQRFIPQEHLSYGTDSTDIHQHHRQ
jgi:hypothetical protein